MTILGMDTSGPVASVSVWRGGKPRYSVSADVGLTHSETLMPLVDRALTAAGVSLAEVELIACVAGPGSFTGVRIGVCAARGFALALKIPVARVNALEALSAGAFGFDGEICPILDARRGQVYSARFRFAEGALPERLCPDEALKLTDFIAALPPDGRFLFTGDGLSVHGEAIRAALGSRAILQKPHLAALRAEAACYLADSDPSLRVPGEALEPIYLRKPQAERERDARRGESV